jgi:hypothetical protein
VEYRQGITVIRVNDIKHALESHFDYAQQMIVANELLIAQQAEEGERGKRRNINSERDDRAAEGTDQDTAAVTGTTILELVRKFN